MAVKINNLENSNNRIVESLRNFHVLEYMKISARYGMSEKEYSYREMGGRYRQLIVDLDGVDSLVALSSFWFSGNINSTTLELLNKGRIMHKYTGAGKIAINPIRGHIILQDMSEWVSGMKIESWTLLACDGRIKLENNSRPFQNSTNYELSSIQEYSLCGNGIVALKSPVPMSELITVELDNDAFILDEGNPPLCWSTSLRYELSESGLKFKGTGKILFSPINKDSFAFDDKIIGF